MRAAEAKELALGSMLGGLGVADGLTLIDPASPDGDPAKFLIDGKVARAIHHFDGWYAPINMGWFAGSYDQPMINRTPFYWYVFAIPAKRRAASAMGGPTQTMWMAIPMRVISSEKRCCAYRESGSTTSCMNQ